MSKTPVSMTNELYQYLVTHSVRYDEHLAGLYQETIALPAGKMVSSPEQVQFMMLLLQLMQAQRVLEVGTFTGFATLALAKALPAAGRLITCDIQNKFRHIGQHYWQAAGVDTKIESVVMPALSFLDELLLAHEEASFDFVYVDADKRNYHAYFEKLLMLVRRGGLILFDNVLWGGEVLNTDNQEPNTLAIRQFNASLMKDERIDLSMIALGDGLTLARVK